MTKLLSKKSFIAFLIVCAVIVLAGIVAVSVAGFNADATVEEDSSLFTKKYFQRTTSKRKRRQ